LIKYIEAKFECTGICKSPFFYYTQPTLLGMPQVSCANRLVEAVGDDIYVMGYVLCCISGTMLLMVLVSMPMCHISKSKLKDEEMEKLDKIM